MSTSTMISSLSRGICPSLLTLLRSKHRRMADRLTPNLPNLLIIANLDCTIFTIFFFSSKEGGKAEIPEFYEKLTQFSSLFSFFRHGLIVSLKDAAPWMRKKLDSERPQICPRITDCGPLFWEEGGWRPHTSLCFWEALLHILPSCLETWHGRQSIQL